MNDFNIVAQLNGLQIIVNDFKALAELLRVNFLNGLCAC